MPNPRPTPGTLTPKQPARHAKQTARREARKLARARRILKRARAADGMKARLIAGVSVEEIARGISEMGDALLRWDDWINGAAEPIGDILERVDGPALYEAARFIAREVREGLVRVGVIVE
jgi:hypothetical protein